MVRNLCDNTRNGKGERIKALCHLVAPVHSAGSGGLRKGHPASVGVAFILQCAGQRSSNRSEARGSGFDVEGLTAIVEFHNLLS